MIINRGFAQTNTTQKFYSLFTEIEFDVLHIYSFARCPGTFRETSTYPFKGIEIDSTSFSLLEDGLDPIDIDIKDSRFYATYRFYLTSKLEVLLLREFHDGGQEHHIHYLVYDHSKNNITEAVKLSYAYGYEGSSGAMESWILDLNKDGQKDILTRSWSHSYIGRDALEVSHDSTVISIWKENELIQTGISDTLLKKQLENDFPYYKKNRLSYTTKRQLENYLKNQTDIQIADETVNTWCIVTGNNSDLSSAKIELEHAKKIIGINHKYNLDYRLFRIHKKKDLYYTIIKDFDTKTEAEIALLAIKKELSEAAYIVDLNNWCKETEYQSGGYYSCEE